MTARFVAVAAGLVLVGPSFAQPPTPSQEQRLKALEEKVDRVVKLLEAREAPKSPAASETTLKALTAARDKLRDDLAAAERRYADFQLKNPYTIFTGPNGSRNLYAERLATIEARRSEMKIKRGELQDRLARIEKAYDGGKNRQAAMRLVLGPKSTETAIADAERSRDTVILQLSAERRKLVAGLGEKHPAVKDVDDAIALVRKTYAAVGDAEIESHLAELRAEIKFVDGTVRALDNMFDVESKQAKEMNAYEVEGERLRAEVERLRTQLTDVEKQLRDASGRPAK
jgi:hypothetical protein